MGEDNWLLFVKGLPRSTVFISCFMTYLDQLKVFSFYK